MLLILGSIFVFVSFRSMFLLIVLYILNSIAWFTILLLSGLYKAVYIPYGPDALDPYKHSVSYCSVKYYTYCPSICNIKLSQSFPFISMLQIQIQLSSRCIKV